MWPTYPHCSVLLNIVFTTCMYVCMLVCDLLFLELRLAFTHKDTIAFNISYLCTFILHSACRCLKYPLDLPLRPILLLVLPPLPTPILALSCPTTHTLVCNTWRLTSPLGCCPRTGFLPWPQMAAEQLTALRAHLPSLSSPRCLTTTPSPTLQVHSIEVALYLHEVTSAWHRRVPSPPTPMTRTRNQRRKFFANPVTAKQVCPRRRV